MLTSTRSRLFFFFLYFALCLLPLSAQADDLYLTDFSGFTEGLDTWAGTEGWTANLTNAGAQGILFDVLPGIGNSAFLGANAPGTNLVTVSRELNYDPLNEGMTLIDLDTTLGMADSTNTFRDSFFLSIKNQNGFRLASIRFSNEATSFGIWREDGAQQHDTGVDFPIDELFVFSLRIDYLSNRWSAFLGTSPVFVNQPFNQTGETLDLGSLSFDWQVARSNLAEYGDNFLIVDDLNIRSSQVLLPPFPMDQFQFTPSNQAQISWMAEPGFAYQLQYSNDLTLWRSDLPGSFYAGFIFSVPITFTDSSVTNAVRRYYRINRSSE